MSLLCVLLGAPSWVLAATTWYVRPATDGNGTDLNYGAEDGTSSANAFDGFADVTGLTAGDTVCLPGGDEPFFEVLNATTTAGTAGLPITWAGCGATQALIWGAFELTGDRSLDASYVAVNGATYAWATVSTDLYRKKMDVRARVLWEDATWLQPIDIDAASEATIISTLTAGQWGVKDNGDATYRIYYKSTTSAKSPTTTTIRSHLEANGGMVVTDKAYQTFRNIEIRGASASAQARSLRMADGATNIRLETMRFFHNAEGPFIFPETVANNDTTLLNTDVLYSSSVGVHISPGVGLNRFTIDGGNYSYSTGSRYNGTGFTAGDGDGISIGQAGGTATDVVIRNVTVNGNAAAGILFGTEPYEFLVTNVTMTGVTMNGNRNSCFSEGDFAQIVGTLILSGFLCTNTIGNSPLSAASVFFASNPPSARTVVMTNGTFAGNGNLFRVQFRPHANNNYQFRNLVFIANPGDPAADYGDFYSNQVNLIGDEVFDNIYFYSLPGLNRRFARLNVANTAYTYSAAGDLAAFNTATGATNTFKNVDPLLISTTNFRPQLTSPLRRAGTATPYCRDVRDRVCPSGLPTIGAYQVETRGDPAAARTAITQPRAPRVNP